ncbi:hypothetical protein BDZ90DRAFT_234128 [Jaminaea rosea]|uniref:Zinc finger CHCC-type domain-containing protein n=1 Tax=Jaminaea rosea TaxID=1569628 RepID=A0A316ULM4_9BASI|nr:hypothetical protein BDZ90DRAFT_234128 [Jaminaea rosea]PWN25281.1 hypothetical protein BDZ90DRAFT_234128 [Jaminaea rosea]
MLLATTTASRSLLSSAPASSSRLALRTFSSTPTPLAGFFQRPAQVPTLRDTQTTPDTTSKDTSKVAYPHTVPGYPAEQSPNYPATWSKTQQPRDEAWKGPRFEQMNAEMQPMPLSAMAMIAKEPIRLVQGRKAMCDGGKGALGHPRVFINLDKAGPKACPWCGLRYEQDHGDHH